MKRSFLLVFVMIFLPSPEAVADPPYALTAQVVSSPLAPAHIQEGVSRGMGQWNSPGCNTNGVSFPKFVTGSADVVIQVDYRSGSTPINDLRDYGSYRAGYCGGYITGDNRTIILYKELVYEWDSGLIERFDCFGGPFPQDVVSDVIAHELGHFLGLDNVSGSGAIMSPMTFSGGGPWGTERVVQGYECDLADENAWTMEEEQIECEQGDPDCDSEATGQYSPILINFDRGRFELSDLLDAVPFDLNADGDLEVGAWPLAGEAFLALDRNGNGTIDSGSELFGDATLLTSGQPAAHGYQVLAEFDINGDGVVDADDPVYGSLLLWFDFDRNGRSTADELFSLAAIGVEAVETSYVESRRRDRHGNELRYHGKAWLREGGRLTPLQSADAFLVVRRTR